MAMHETEVLTGDRAAEIFGPRFAAVAFCSCGWFEKCIHGQEAEQKAQEHLESEAKVA